MSVPKKNTILQINNLAVEFQQEGKVNPALRGINFEVKRGESLGIVGESGSGKSITALSIMGLLPENGIITKGTVNWKAKSKMIDLNALSEKERENYRGNRMSMIFQEPMTALNPVISCGQQIAEVLTNRKSYSKDQAVVLANSLLTKVKLPRPERIFKSFPHQLSGGQRQRVMIAMALASEPDLIIADEPTTALDVSTQKTILELLKELVEEENIALLFISHDLGIIKEICDRVLVMFQGQIVEENSVDKIFNFPEHAYTKSLLACRPSLTSRPKRLPVLQDFLKIETTKEDEIIIVEKTPDDAFLKRTEIIPSRVSQKKAKALSASSPILSVKKLNAWFSLKRNFFGKPTAFVKAVQDFSFDIYPGEILGLVGESGSGKSSLGRAILKLIDAQSGQVTFEKKNLLKLSDSQLKAVRKNIQIVFQDPFGSLNPRHSIGQSISEPLKVHGFLKSKSERKDKVVDLLKLVGLEARHYYRFPHEFSGGQRQRICIARALAVEPKLLICDECVSSLDVSVQAQILNLLLDLREKLGLTFLFISHDMAVVKYISDRIMVMQNGNLVEIGIADELFEKPKKLYTQSLIQAIPKGI